MRRVPAGRNRRAGRGRAGLLTLVVVLAGAQPAEAAAGDPDRTFNGTGKVHVFERGNTTTAAVQALGANKGKIVVGTSSGLVRFTTSGAIDTSFAQAGTASSPYVYDLAVRSDDSLVTVHGWAAEGLVVRRFTSAGKPSTSLPVPIPGFLSGTATAVAMAPGGRIIVAGVAETGIGACVPVVFWNVCQSAGGNAVVARLLPDGAIDNAFGVNGIAFLGGYAGRASPVDVAIRPDGSVAVIGNPYGYYGIGPNSFHSVVSLLRPDGRPDTAFGEAGEVISGPTRAASVQFDDKGRILVAGTDYRSPTYRPGINLTRLLPDGDVDPSFATMGVARWPESCDCSEAASVLVVPRSHPGGGRIIVAGSSSANLAAVAFEYETGTLDVQFGNGGSVVPGPGLAKATALTPDGKLLVAGGRYAGEMDILLYRYHLQ